jgi:tetratricopeptide (TPR) repeat protein
MQPNQRWLAFFGIIWIAFAYLAGTMIPLFHEHIDETAELLGLDWLGSFFSIFLVAVVVTLPLLTVIILHVTGCTPTFVIPALARRFTPNGRALERNRAGISLHQRGGYVAAIAEFTEALRLNPYLAAAFANRASAYYHLNRLEEALKDADEALCRQPNSLAALTIRALILMNRSEHEHALEDLNRAIAAGGKQAILFSARGSVLLVKNDFDGALSDCTEAIFRSNNAAGDFSNRGMAWLGKGNYDRAIADFDEAIRLEPDGGLAFNNRGVAFLKQGAYEHALADFRNAMRLAPELPNSYKNLAWLLATCPAAEFRDGEEAVIHAQKALRLANQSPAEWLGILAAAHAEAGNFEEAIGWQSQCLDGSPAPFKSAMEARLALFRAHQPYREPSPNGSTIQPAH